MLVRRDIILMLIGVFLSIIVGCFISNYPSLAVSLEVHISYKWMMIISLSLLIVLGLMASYIYYLKKQISNIIKGNKLDIDDYEQPKELCGVSRHKKTGKLYCTSCLVRNVKSPVINEMSRWKCALKDCNKCYYKNSKNVTIPSSGYSFQDPDIGQK